MHYHAELVIPPTNDVDASVAELMAPFSQNLEGAAYGGWWDYFSIGGRFSGEKLIAALDPDKLQQFKDRLKQMKVTVSGIKFGKDELSPPEQAETVDALWRELFPGTCDQCPYFQHSRGKPSAQYGKVRFGDDICKVADIPEWLVAHRLIVAAPHWKELDKIIADRMWTSDTWNAVEHQKTAFDGKVVAALNSMKEDRRGAKFETDWLVVTVDYHS